MDQTQMQGQAPQEGAEGEGSDGALQAFKSVQTALDNMLQGLSNSGAPPEALSKLQEAQKSYGEFVSMLSGSPAMAPQGSAPANANATGQGVNPVPSM